MHTRMGSGSDGRSVKVLIAHVHEAHDLEGYFTELATPAIATTRTTTTSIL